ncbi:MAG TPA: hypothetical protein VME23_01260 [Terracidiphilus sp.]|nr:hypothetical protein [Terracidiphilus sp.]
MRKLSVLIGLFVCVLAAPSFSWAGTCPTGANYLNTTNPTGPLVTLSSLGVTNCFYIAANGSDSNDGASEVSGHPWAHAPGMTSCTGNCAANKPAGGDGYIFRGGDTWHEGNSSASPYTGGTWAWTWSGASSAYMYIGVDPAWYSGASWVRPVITGDNPPSTSAVSNCRYSTGAHNLLVGLQGIRYYFFDNFEITGLCASDKSLWNDLMAYSGAVAGFNGNNTMVIENNYFHGITYTTAATQDAVTAASGYNQNWGVLFRFNVVDGSDGDPHALSIFGQGTDTYDIEYNWFYDTGGSNVSDVMHVVHDNVWEDFYNVSDGSTHSDLLQVESEQGSSNYVGDGTPNLWYDNLIYNLPGAVSAVWLISAPTNYTDYIFNNVVHDYNANGGNFLNICDTSCPAAPTALEVFNNTMESPTQGYGGCIFCNINGSSPKITSVNNQWITAGSTIASVFQFPSYVTESTPVYQTITQANGQGYNSADNFAPTASSNSTVTASGADEYGEICSTLAAAGASSNAVAACRSGTTDGCSYDSSNHTVRCPSGNTRPSSGSWNVGAYQFAGIQPSSPTSLTGQAVPQ